MSICQAEVVMRAKHVCRDHSRVVPSMLLPIAPANTHSYREKPLPAGKPTGNKQINQFLPVEDNNHSLGVGIAVVGFMRCP